MKPLTPESAESARFYWVSADTGEPNLKEATQTYLVGGIRAAAGSVGGGPSPAPVAARRGARCGPGRAGHGAAASKCGPCTPLPGAAASLTQPGGRVVGAGWIARAEAAGGFSILVLSPGVLDRKRMLPCLSCGGGC